ncbi:hypothetical protein F4818DRAFT_418556 [Hypoxylon cercidicola]|nr:hypothetical protein F4818DRAFT_418556 [Hypoxylon cercidicola]
MCVISQTLCPRCGRKSQGYVFSPCCDFTSQITDQPDDTFFGHRLSCPNFIWPIPGPIPVKVQHCEDCLYRPGYSYSAVSINEDSAGAAVDLYDIIADLTELHGELDGDEKKDDRHHRHLTLRIPYCDLCKKPYYCLSDNENTSWFDEKEKDGGEDSAEPTIQGIEFEFSSILWKWMRLTRLWQVKGHEAIEINLLTGFIHRPCNTCINRETVLRGKVILFIQRCDTSEAWAVWMWLMMRGSDQVNFWQHELRNLGLPALAPPIVLEYRALMATGWKARTGVAWEDIYDVELGEYPLLFTPHSEIFTSLSQWNAFARIYRQPDPVAMLPPPLLDTNNVTIEYEPAVERVSRQQIAQDGHEPAQASGAAKNDKAVFAATTPLRLRQTVPALHKPAFKIRLRSSDDDEEDHHPAKRLRFADEVDILGESPRQPHADVQPMSSSPADSDHTLVEPDDIREDKDDDTVAVLTPCEFGFYHVRYMEPNRSWQLPLGVDLGEETPLALLPRSEQPDVAEAADKGKGPEIVPEAEGKGKEPEMAATEGKGKESEVVATEGEGKGKGKGPEIVVIGDNGLGEGLQQRLQQRAGTGRHKRDPLVLSSDESSTYSDSSE